MRFSELISKVHFILVDAGVVYPADVVRGWLVDAERVIVALASGANPATVVVSSVAGTRQRIPDAGVRLLVVNTVGGHGVRLVERGNKDESDPLWRNEPAASSAAEYILDPRMPREFDVSPPVVAGVQIGLSYDQIPGPYDFDADEDPDITLLDIYGPAMVDYAVHRCLARADENTPEWAKSQAHYKMFMETVAGKTSVDAAQSAKQGGFLR